MDEKITNMAQMSDDQLESVAGGKKHKNKKAERTKNLCPECMKGTNIAYPNFRSHIYSARGSNETCCQNGHIFANDMYIKFSIVEVKKWFSQHS